MRKSKKWIILLCFGMLSASGCASVETWSESALMESALEELPDFAEDMKKFDELKAEGRITENGEVIELVETEPVKEASVMDTTGMIHVTFASNNLLDVSYYKDAELTQPLSKEGCYLSPNDCIYAAVPKCKNEFSNMYSFECFRIYQHDADGKRTVTETVPLNENKLVYQIPMLTEEAGISIVPLGQYTNRQIVMNDYLQKSNGEKQELSGVWTVNNKEYNHELVEISPLASYDVSYKYKGEMYYFISASPADACRFPKEKGDAEGEVIFKRQEAEMENPVENFSVELHEYLSATIENKAKGLVYTKVNDREENEKISDKVEISKLKCGSVIEFKTDILHKLESTSVNLNDPTEVEDGFIYMVEVPEQADGKLNFFVNNWDKKTLDITVDKSTSETLLDKIGNLFSGGNEKESIVTLYAGGNSYTYEELQKGKEVVLNEYDDLEIVVNKNLPKDSQVHIVIDNEDIFIVKPDSEELRKTLDYEDVSSLRITIQNTENENANQKTKLEVILDKSLGGNILFSVDASGKNIVKEVGYIKGMEKIFNGNVDAEQEIILSANNMQLNSKKAVKLTVEKDGECTEIRYVKGQNLSETMTAAVNENYCGEMKIIISLVDVVSHKACAGENCTIQLQFKDADRKIIADGDWLEEDRDVILTIIAKEGYYIDSAFGHGWHMQGDNVYQREMKYSKYVKEIEEILKKNPVKQK